MVKDIFTKKFISLRNSLKCHKTHLSDIFNSQTLESIIKYFLIKLAMTFSSKFYSVLYFYLFYFYFLVLDLLVPSFSNFRLY